MENTTRDVHFYRLTKRPSAPPDPPKPKLPRATRIVVGVVTLLVVVLLLLHLISLPFSRTMTALEIKPDDPTYAVERTIRISGKYRMNLFYSDSFTGHITADGFALSVPVWETEQTVFWNTLQYLYVDRELFWDYLSYVTAEDEAEAYRDRTPFPTGRFAELYYKPFFHGLIMGIFEEDTSGACPYSSLLVVGAETREEALELLQSRLPFEYESWFS